MGYKEHYRGVSDGDFDLMPEGDYPIKITESSIGQSKSSSNDTWKLVMEVTAGEYQGRKLWFYVSMSEKAKGIRRGTMTALGFDPEMENDLTDDVINKTAKAEVFHETYEGKTREKVKRLRTGEQVAPGQTKIDDDLNGGEGLPF